MSDAQPIQPWLPSITSRAVLTWLAAGFVGLVAFGLVIRLVTPALFGMHPHPAMLARELLVIDSLTVALLAHWAGGLLLFPLIYVLLVRPFLQRVIPDMPWWLAGGFYGTVLWLVVLGLLVLGVGTATVPPEVLHVIWPGLLAHVAYGLAFAGVLHIRQA